MRSPVAATTGFPNVVLVVGVVVVAVVVVALRVERSGATA